MNDEQGRRVALGLLSFTAGVMDAIAFLTLGEVFTSAMSGNTILLGLALGQGRIYAAFHSLAAFAGYICGVGGAALPLRRPRGIELTLGLEILFLAAFAGFWAIRGGPAGPFELYVLILLSAIAMGLQGAVGRAMRISGIPTIVVTSTLTAIIGTIAEKILSRERPILATPTRHQITSFLLYLASAALAGFALTRWRDALPFVPPAAVLALVLGLRSRMLRL